MQFLYNFWIILLQFFGYWMEPSIQVWWFLPYFYFLTLNLGKLKPQKSLHFGFPHFFNFNFWSNFSRKKEKRPPPAPHKKKKKKERERGGGCFCASSTPGVTIWGAMVKSEYQLPHPSLPCSSYLHILGGNIIPILS
jgi:hypothetical protein